MSRTRRTILVFIGAAAGVCALLVCFNVLPWAFHRHRMHVDYGDGTEAWFDIREPDHFSTRGLEHVEDYVNRLLASKADFPTIGISTADGERGLSIWHRNKRLEFHFAPAANSQEEKDIRRFFAERGIAPSQDYLFQNGPVPNSGRVLAFPFQSDPKAVTELTLQILRDIYRIKPDDGLNLIYEETQKRQNT